MTRTIPGPLRGSLAHLGASTVIGLVSFGASPAAVSFTDLARLQVPARAAIAPSGKRIVWELTTPDTAVLESRTRIQLWEGGGTPIYKRVANAFTGGTSTAAAPRFITRADEDASDARFLPEEDAVSFLSARGEDARTQVWVLSLRGGEGEAWTDSPTDVESYAWGPDETLFFLAEIPLPQAIAESRDRSHRDGDDATVADENRRPKSIWHIRPGDTSAERFELSDPGIVEFAVSFDGARIAYVSDTTGDPTDWKKRDLWLLDVATGLVSRLTDRPGGESSPQWSEDGTTIYFLAAMDSLLAFSPRSVFAVPAAGGRPTRVVPDLDREVTEFVSCPGSDKLFAVVAEGTNERLYRLHPKSGKAFVLCADPGRLGGISVKSNGEKVAFVQEGPAAAPEIATWSFPDEYTELVTSLNADVTASADAEHRVVTWNAPDGTTVEGLVVLPAEWDGASPLPTIVYPHGGPASHSVNTMRCQDFDAWAERGYAVFAPNFRGSIGYGRAFAVANVRDLGGGDLDDLLSGVDRLVADGIADPERLGIMGASYGGFLTNKAIATTDRFRAAVSMYGIADLVTDSASSQYSEWEWDYLRAYFWEDPEIYAQLSPLATVERVHTPTLLLHGESDDTTTLANSREWYRSLKGAGVTAELVVYPREGHGFEEPRHVLDAWNRSVRWFDHYLLGKTMSSRDFTEIEEDAAPWSFVVNDVQWSRDLGGQSARAGWLTVDVLVTADAPVEGKLVRLAGEDADFSLESDLFHTTPSAIPVPMDGTTRLIHGEPTAVLSGSPREDNAAWSFRLAFELTIQTSPARLRLWDLPPAEIRWQPDRTHADSTAVHPDTEETHDG